MTSHAEPQDASRLLPLSLGPPWISQLQELWFPLMSASPCIWEPRFRGHSNLGSVKKYKKQKPEVTVTIPKHCFLGSNLICFSLFPLWILWLPGAPGQKNLLVSHLMGALFPLLLQVAVGMKLLIIASAEAVPGTLGPAENPTVPACTWDSLGRGAPSRGHTTDNTSLSHSTTPTCQTLCWAPGTRCGLKRQSCCPHRM